LRQYPAQAIHRAAVLVVMLFAMLWQSMALARVGSSVNVLADPDHAALHWQEEGHHHNEDGSYHLDDSHESAQHLADDHLSASLPMVAMSLHHFPALRSAALQQLQDDVERRVRTGDLSRADALAAQAERLAATAQQADAGQRLQAARSRWTLLTGLGACLTSGPARPPRVSMGRPRQTPFTRKCNWRANV
jgi:hypothetical protein